MIYIQLYEKEKLEKLLKSGRKSIDSTYSFYYTLKTKVDFKSLAITELESEISEEEYNKLDINKLNFEIEKVRVKVPIKNGLIAEIDLYHNELEGLITVEVEFNSEEEADMFEPPVWFGSRLDKKIFSNYILANMDNNDLKNIISKDEMINNLIIKEKIENLFTINK